MEQYRGVEPILKGTVATGERLRAVRRALGLTQAEVAQLTSCRIATVSDWENGKTYPSDRMREKLHVVIGRDPKLIQWVRSGEGEMPNIEPWTGRFGETLREAKWGLPRMPFGGGTPEGFTIKQRRKDWARFLLEIAEYATNEDTVPVAYVVELAANVLRGIDSAAESMEHEALRDPDAS